MNNFTARRHR